MALKMTKRRLALAVLVAIFAVMDLAPYKTGPFFRYTGSDPERAVWHLGWPLPMAIYDGQAQSQAGDSWFFAPHAAAVAAAQMLVLALLLRSTIQRNPPPGSDREEERE
jgi:hypothetical protein